jgi:hypothetical protein
MPTRATADPGASLHTRTHLPHYVPPGGRRAPRRIQELIREIDPEAELIYGGTGVWMLGSVRPNQLVRRKAERGMAHLLHHLGKAGQASISIPSSVKREIAFRFWWWNLLRQGWRPISRYPKTPGERIYGEPGSWIVEDFRERDWRYRSQFDYEITMREQEADQETREGKAKDRLIEYLVDMHKDIHRHAFRRPHINVPKRRIV